MRIAALLLVPVAALLAGQQQATQVAQDSTRVMKTSDSGVYTNEQAELGKVTYESVCATCHLLPEFSDNTFKNNWDRRAAFELFEKIRSTMPEDNPGGLPRGQYLELVSYFLKVNGAPPGKVALPSDSAALTLIRMDIRKAGLAASTAAREAKSASSATRLPRR